MHIFNRRPFFLICVCGILTAVAAQFISGVGKLSVMAIAVLCLLASCVFLLVFRSNATRHRRVAWRVFGISFAVLLMLGSSFLYWNRYCEKVFALDGTTHTVSATVTEWRYSDNSMTGYTVSVNQIDGEPVSYNCILSCSFASDLQIGYTFEGDILFENAETIRNGYEEKRDLLSEGIVCKLAVDDARALQITGENASTVAIFFSRINEKLSSVLYNAVGGGEEGALLIALTLGNRSRLDELTTFTFRRSGVSHLLALSGLHMSVIMGAVMFLLTKICIPKKGRAVLMMLFSFLYLSITGFSQSACRATVMLAVLYLSYLCRAERDVLTALGAAAAGILLFNPPAVLSIAFWLSVSATFGIVVFSAPIHDAVTAILRVFPQNRMVFLKKGLQKLLSAFAVSVVAMFSILAFSFAWFHECALLGIPMTVLLSPLTAVLLILGCLLLLFSAVPFLGTLLAFCGKQIAVLMLSLTKHAADIPKTVVPLNYPGIGYVIGAFLLAMTILLIVKLRHRIWLLVPPVLCCVGIALLTVFGIQASEKGTNATYIHMSSTAEGLLLTSGTDAVFCDLGNGSAALYYAATHYMTEQCATSVEALVLTSYHSSHPIYLKSLCERIPVSHLYVPAPQTEKEWYLYVPLYNRAAELGVPISFYKADEDGIASVQVFSDGRLTVSTATISRSVRKCNLVCYENGNCRVSCLGSAIEETDLAESAANAVLESDLVIFGSYGPVPKQPFSYLFANGTQLVFGTQKRAAYWDTKAITLPKDLPICPCPEVYTQTIAH